MLDRFLRTWIGAWPAPEGLVVVGSPQRERPRWDGAEQRVLGVLDGAGNGVLSVPPASRDAVAGLLARSGPEDLLAHLPALVGRPEQRCFTGVFRWTQTPAALPDAGEWEPSGGAGLPEWLRPFPGEVLVAREPGTGEFLCGVGLKPHDPTGVEIAVGTAEQARGRGLARRLVARAARRIVDASAVALYLHDPDNIASAHVAAAAGFPDRGWKIIALAGAE
ncbi:GNAT family N-acetyltransferase [Dactylosporangium vinaceum]|uniref:GNAT family N-acetyltransferase n=1 Tax=Dactylosporangium vinaceum TaxID=53362 RepID=A0ABV5MJG0_9ACTN|nr:GNAT family N-acetyltransferase [Dactylosporangium vinaceum]UAB93568.1 GNAT family N-acetyltransferase [Dactylosporangium vinaceum]